MELYKIVAIAKKIFKELKNIETESCRREWQFSLYYAISMALKNSVSEPQWIERYSQWNIDHNFRGHEARLRARHSDLIVDIILITEIKNGVHIKVSIKTMRESKPIAFNLTREDFRSLERIGEKEKRVLFTNENALILESLLELEQAHAAEEEELLHGMVNDKILALEALLGPVREIYANQSNIGKSYIETVVGASIFYLPHPVNKCFSGYCSINALNDKINNKSIVKEHITPRKHAAKEVLHEEYNSETFYADCLGRFRRFMYLTSEENRRTVNYTDVTHDAALLNLEIETFPSGSSPFANNHTYFAKYIRFCKEKRRLNEVLTIESAMILLQKFINENPA
jgi:hypothetical protein